MKQKCKGNLHVFVSKDSKEPPDGTVCQCGAMTYYRGKAGDSKKCLIYKNDQTPM